jgi:hypothetical protein
MLRADSKLVLIAYGDSKLVCFSGAQKSRDQEFLIDFDTVLGPTKFEIALATSFATAFHLRLLTSLPMAVPGRGSLAS